MTTDEIRVDDQVLVIARSNLPVEEKVKRVRTRALEMAQEKLADFVASSEGRNGIQINSSGGLELDAGMDRIDWQDVITPDEEELPNRLGQLNRYNMLSSLNKG